MNKKVQVYNQRWVSYDLAFDGQKSRWGPKSKWLELRSPDAWPEV